MCLCENWSDGYDNFDETFIFEHLLLMILYRQQTKFGIRKSNTTY